MYGSGEDRKRAFNLLDELEKLSHEELKVSLTDDKVKLIREVSKLLLDRDLDEIKDDKGCYFDVIKTLYETKIRWSRKLGTIILESSDVAEKVGKREAIMLLVNFIQNCSAPFYREVAQNQIATLERKYTN